jgi:hypothetical protein
MFQKILNFIKYNNAFTIGLMMLFVGAGMSFAASPALRDGVYSSSDIVTSVDNHNIVSADLDNFDFNLKINSVTEDTDNYYVAYSYQTMAIADNVWQKVPQSKTLTVSKESLASMVNKDLGLYVADQLGSNINYELSYLKKVQDLQKSAGVSQKIVTTEYSGLIGKLIDPKEKIVEGYTPVIPEPVPVVPATSSDTVANNSGTLPAAVVANPASTPPPASTTPEAPSQVPPSTPLMSQGEVNDLAVQQQVAQMLAEQTPPAPAPEPTPTETLPPPATTPPPAPIPTPDTTPPVITLLGSPTIALNVGDTYTEAGTIVKDNVDASVVVVAAGSVDTSKPGTYTLTYNATDTAGNKAKEMTRTVTVNAVTPPPAETTPPPAP